MENQPASDRMVRTDGLVSADLVPVDGGTWRGLLFDNPRIGLAPQLTWTFEFRFREAIRDFGSSPVSLTLDWIPLAASTWRAVGGRQARSAAFSEGGEASAYFFDHHRYTNLGLDLLAQRDESVSARATVSGDMDALGIETITAEAWLQFAGITVALSDVDSASAALSRLLDFTETAGLSPTPIPQHNRFRFIPAST